MSGQVKEQTQKNVTDHFKNTIRAYLEQRAASDPLFAISFKKPEKNMTDCITCILNMVQKSGIKGFMDDEIYSMAVHYYDEDNINIGNPINCQAIVNHTVQLTKEEIEQARKDAIQQVHQEAYNSLKQPKKKTKSTEVSQASLF